MKLQKLAFATMISLTASLAQAGYFLDLPSRQIVQRVEAPKDQSAPFAETIWVRYYRADEIENANLGTQMPVVPRQKKDLIDVVNDYKGTRAGHSVRITDPTDNKTKTAHVVAVFANNMMRVDVAYYGSYIKHEQYDVPVEQLHDRQVSELNGVKKDQKLCAVNADKKIKAGQKLEIDGVWISGRVDVNKGSVSEFLYAFSLTSQKHTHISNLKSCE